VLYKSKDEAYQAYREAPDNFFATYHNKWFNDKDLISPEWSWYETKYHYNLVENSIIDILLSQFEEITARSVLDVGAGTGRWIEFYDRYLDASSVAAVDFSAASVQKLRDSYSRHETVEIHQADISVRSAAYQGKFDVVNAIGVMFHLVDDKRWEQAVENVFEYLSVAGVAVVGGEFGRETRELGVMRQHRSLECWESLLDRIGARVINVQYHEWFKGGVNDGLKTNLLAFVRA